HAKQQRSLAAAAAFSNGEQAPVEFVEWKEREKRWRSVPAEPRRPMVSKSRGISCPKLGRIGNIRSVFRTATGRVRRSSVRNALALSTARCHRRPLRRDDLGHMTRKSSVL